ncbi:hypothetical protein NAI44_10375, partial [Francisella tularensis subsp. holarctica]|nr:hypothetical protein [Francisella tularensis subsp. holarctica]
KNYQSILRFFSGVLSDYEDAYGITAADINSVRKVMVKYLANSFAYDDDFNFEYIIAKFISLNNKLSFLKSDIGRASC